MIVDITEENFNEYLNRGEGYLVNKTSTAEAKAHDLTHLSGTCRSQLEYDPDDIYSKFWVATLPLAQQVAQQRWRVPCSECGHCRE